MSRRKRVQRVVSPGGHVGYLISNNPDNLPPIIMERSPNRPPAPPKRDLNDPTQREMA